MNARLQHPREIAARERKVRALLSVLVQSAQHHGVELTAESLVGMDWGRAARLAGITPPSPQTIDMVIERVRSGHVARRAEDISP